MNSTMKKFIPTFAKTAIEQRGTKTLAKRLAKREADILSKVKINNGVSQELSANIKENADSIGRYARRHGVHLEITPASEDLFSKEQMSVRRNKLEIESFQGYDDKTHSYPVIKEYEIGQIALDKTQDAKGTVLNIKEGINTAIKSNKENPEKAKYTRFVASFFTP